MRPATANAHTAHQLRRWLRERYFGRSPAAARFAYGLLTLDSLILAQFLWLTFTAKPRWYPGLELAFGLLVSLDLVARFWAAPRRLRRFIWLPTLTDLVVALSFFLPLASANLGFLRVLSAVRIARAYHLIHILRRHSPWVRQRAELIDAVVDLFLFIFILSAVVWLSQHRINPKIVTYLDALYFTVTTLSTTGLGDITLERAHGRVLSMVIMLTGISLFFRLVQAVFRPDKVRHTCPRCGLLRHDADAVHCKHCGEVLNIPSEGD